MFWGELRLLLLLLDLVIIECKLAIHFYNQNLSMSIEAFSPMN